MFARVAVKGGDRQPTAEHAGHAHAPVVMVHGLGISSRYMVPAARRLGNHRAVYAPDLPGFGKSESPARVLTIPGMANALAAWMDVQGLKNADFVGNSIGCQVITHLAVSRPGMVGRAVFVGPTFDPASRYVVPLLLRALLDTRWEPASLSPLVIRDYLSAGPIRLIMTLWYALRDPVASLLPAVKSPVLVVRGEHDAVVPKKWAREVVRLLPEARLVVVRGASHAVHFSDPDRFVRIALPFLGHPDRPGGI